MTKSISERAIDAYKSHQEGVAEKEAENLAFRHRRTHEDFVYRFGGEPDRLDGDFAFFEGQVLSRNPGMSAKPEYWMLLGICPHCGEEVDSQRIYNLVDLGEQLTEFQPDFDHRCEQAETGPGPVEVAGPTLRLVQALDEYIAEHIREQTDF